MTRRWYRGEICIIDSPRIVTAVYLYGSRSWAIGSITMGLLCSDYRFSIQSCRLTSMPQYCDTYPDAAITRNLAVYCAACAASRGIHD